METRNWIIIGKLPSDVGFFAVNLSGAFDGVNANFSLSPAPTGGVMVFWNGQLLAPGLQPSGQYLFAGRQIIFQPQAIPSSDINIEVFGWSTSNNAGFQGAQLVGTIGGGNTVFALSPAPTNGAMVFWNGQLLTEGTQDTNPVGQYLLSGAIVTFQPQAIPPEGTTLTAFVF